MFVLFIYYLIYIYNLKTSKMKQQIQVVENSDRFHVSLNRVPQFTFLHGNGISKSFAQMNANSEAFKLAVKLSGEGNKIKLLEQAIK